MKTISKITKKLGAVLAAVMVFTLSFGMSVFAANIQVNAPSGTSINGMTVNAYKMLDLEAGSGNQATYTVNEDFSALFADAKAAYTGTVEAAGTVYLTYDYTNHKLVLSADTSAGAIDLENTTKLDSTYFEADLISRLTANEDKALFSAWTADYVEANTIEEAGTATATEESSVTITGLGAGYYVVLASDVPAGVSILNSILQVTEADGTVNVNLKAESIPFEKEVSVGGSEPAADATASVGDTLNYTITSKVPDTADFSDITEYVIRDTLTNQLLDQNSLVLTIGATVFKSNPAAGENDINTIATENYGDYTSGSQSFSLTFNTDALAAYKGQEVTLTYSAKLTSDAVNINGNDATLEYTNDGNASSQTAHTDVYTFGMDITKVFSDGSTTHYTDVTFQLRTDASDKATAIGFAGGNGIYVKADSDDMTKTTDLKLTNNGSLTLTGLNAGTYYLVETATAESDGFNLAAPVTVVLTQDADSKADLDGDTTTASMDGTNLNVTISKNEKQVSLAGFEVLNQKGFQLPTTGGAGTWMFTIGGIVLIAAAGGVFFALRRKSGK